MVEIGGSGRNRRESSAGRQSRRPAQPSAVRALRGRVGGFLGRLDVPCGRSADIQLAVTEACGNVVRHAYRGVHGDVLCRCEATDDEIVISVCDWGVGSEQPSLQPGLGLGIPLIERLSDHTTQRRAGGVTLVEMRFDRLRGRVGERRNRLSAPGIVTLARPDGRVDR